MKGARPLSPSSKAETIKAEGHGGQNLAQIMVIYLESREQGLQRVRKLRGQGPDIVSRVIPHDSPDTPRKCFTNLPGVSQVNLAEKLTYLNLTARIMSVLIR